jgi:hypothetical protein
MQGETVPQEQNHVRLSTELKDAWGSSINHLCGVQRA